MSRPDEHDEDQLYDDPPVRDDGSDDAIDAQDARDCLDEAVRDLRRNEVRARMNNTRYAD
jgi:hypothetical protein